MKHEMTLRFCPGFRLFVLILLFVVMMVVHGGDAADKLDSLKENRNLVEEDATFWSRLAHEVVSSSFSAPPTLAPTTPAPSTPAPTTPAPTTPAPTTLAPTTPAPTTPAPTTPAPSTPAPTTPAPTTPAPTTPAPTTPAPTTPAPTTPSPTTPAPTFGPCSVTVILDCVAEDGTPCNELVRPPGTCSGGGPIQTLRFTLEYCTCEEGRNTQETYLLDCSDIGQLPASDETALITCIDALSDKLLFSELIAEGGDITLQDQNNMGLPNDIICSVTSGNGDLLQTFHINTSGQEDLFLKDKFGSFVLEACNDQDCITNVTYSFVAENTGSVDMIVTEFYVESDDGRVDLLEGTTPNIPVGGSYMATQTETIDMCLGGDFLTIGEVAADSPGGIQCSDNAEYFFDISGNNCRLTMDIECMAEDGTDCQDIVHPTGSCNDGNSPTEMTLRYVNSTCDKSMNNQDVTQCSDLGPFPPGAVTVVCLDANGCQTLNVSPQNVSQGETLSLSQPDGSLLPDEVICALSDGSSNPVQQFTFFTRPGNALNLDNKFGSFEIVSCKDPASSTDLTCEVLLCYSYNIGNVGTGSFSLEQLTRTRNNVTDSLLNLLEVTVLEVGDTTTVIEKELTNICGDQEYTTTVFVDADPSIDIICEIEESYTFGLIKPKTAAPTASPSSAPTFAPSVGLAEAGAGPMLGTAAPIVEPSSAPSAAPTAAPSAVPSSTPSVEPLCIFDINITCIPLPPLDSCNATPPPPEQCKGRPFEMVFLYNGGDCEQSFNIQAIDEKFWCEDFDGGPPIVTGEKSYIVVTDKRSRIVYHDDWVAVGDLFTLTDGGERFEADQIITIYKNNNTEDPSNLLQSMQYHSSCSQNLFLKDRFGAVQLVIWVNEEQGIVSCFANQTLEIEVTVPIDITGGPATVQSLEVVSNVDPFFFNFTDKVFGIEVDAGDTLQTQISIPIDLTTRQQYCFFITLKALTSTGRECEASDVLCLFAGFPVPPNFPTFSPTEAPSESPTPGPTPSPTPIPTPDPTPTPTPIPTPEPTTDPPTPCDVLDDTQNVELTELVCSPQTEQFESTFFIVASGLMEELFASSDDILALETAIVDVYHKLIFNLCDIPQFRRILNIAAQLTEDNIIQITATGECRDCTPETSLFEKNVTDTSWFQANNSTLQRRNSTSMAETPCACSVGLTPESRAPTEEEFRYILAGEIYLLQQCSEFAILSQLRSILGVHEQVKKVSCGEEILPLASILFLDLSEEVLASYGSFESIVDCVEETIKSVYNNMAFQKCDGFFRVIERVEIELDDQRRLQNRQNRTRRANVFGESRQNVRGDDTNILRRLSGQSLNQGTSGLIALYHEACYCPEGLEPTFDAGPTIEEFVPRFNQAFGASLLITLSELPVFPQCATSLAAELNVDISVLREDGRFFDDLMFVQEG